jgi:outer membrane protein assembly factor BamB
MKAIRIITSLIVTCILCAFIVSFTAGCENSTTANNERFDGIIDEEIQQTASEIEQEQNLIEDTFVSAIPEGYPEDTLLRTTNDFVIEDSAYKFECYSEDSIDEFVEDKINFITDNVMLEEKWQWVVDDREPTINGYSLYARGNIYPDLWSIRVDEETKYLDPETLNETESKAMLEPLFTDEKTGLSLSYSGINNREGEIVLSDTTGKKYWKLETIYSGNFSFHIVGNYFIDGRDNYGFQISDIINKEPKARVFCTNDDTINYYNYSSIYSNTYFWTIWTDIMGTERKLYRINPSTLEILSYEISIPEKAFFIQGTIYVMNRDRNKLLAIDPETGVITQKINLHDYFPDAKFTCSPATDHPFICKKDDEKYIFNPIDTKLSYKLDYQIRYSNYRSGIWQGWSNFYGLDKDYIFGVDTFTGEKTWMVDISLLGKSPVVVLADHRGVVIAHGNKISAFGIKE